MLRVTSSAGARAVQKTLRLRTLNFEPEHRKIMGVKISNSTILEWLIFRI